MMGPASNAVQPVLVFYDLEERVEIGPKGILWELDMDVYLKKRDQESPAPWRGIVRPAGATDGA